MSKSKSTLIGLLVIAVALFLIFQFYKRTIYTAVFERAVHNIAGVDASEQLPDGLHVYLCGTGSPMPSATRAGPCIGVLAGEQAFIFDVGAGSIRKLQRMGFPIHKLRGTYLTHLHSDHFDGLGELLLLAWVQGARSEPLPVSGPEGTYEVVNSFNQAYNIDRSYRIAHHGADVVNPDGYGGQSIELVLPAGPSAAGTVYENGDIRISAVRVDHAPIEPAFGYRIDYKDRSISISGDTVYHPGFAATSTGVDIMFHEALDPDMVNIMKSAVEKQGDERTAKILHDILDYHATPEDAAKSAAEASAKELVFYHIVPDIPRDFLKGLWLGDAPKEFAGKITVGEDGMFFSMPAGRTLIRRSRAF